MRIRNKSLPVLFAVFAIAFAARTLLFTAILQKNQERFFMHDSFGYLQIAENLLKHGVFSQCETAPFIPDEVRTPLYPLFLAFFRVVHLPVESVIWFQILLSSVTCVWVILILFNLTLKAAMNALAIPGLLLAVDIPSISFANFILTETLFTFLFTASIYFFVQYMLTGRRSSMVLASLLLGFTMLCRPIALGLPLLMAGCCMLQPGFSIQEKLKKTLLFLCIAYSIAGTWLVRNKIVWDEYFLSKINTVVLLYHHAAEIQADIHQTSLAQEQDSLNRLAIRLAEQQGAGYHYVQMRNIEKQLALSIISKHPRLFIKNQLVGATSLLFKPLRSYLDWQLGFYKPYSPGTSGGPSGIWQKLTNSPLPGFMVWQIVLMAIVWVLFVSAIFRLIRHKQWWLALLLLGSIAYFCCLTAGTVTDARFRVPIMPLLALGCGFSGLLVEKHARQK